MKKFLIDKKFSAGENRLAMFRPWKIFLNLGKTNSRPTKYFITTFSCHSFYSLWSQLWEIWSGGALEETFAFAIE